MSPEHEEFMRVLDELRVSTQQLTRVVGELSEVASEFTKERTYGRRLHDELVEETGLSAEDAKIKLHTHPRKAQQSNP